MNDSELTPSLIKTYNNRGLFPAPDENQQSFVNRVNQLPTFNTKTVLNITELKSLFDFKPDWVEFEYNSAKLNFWEAACVVVSDSGYCFYLKDHFQKSSRLMKLYHRDEVVAHECCHIVRMGWQNSKYEEFFAYQTATGLRRFLGPMFSHRLTAWALMLLSSFSLLSDTFLGLHHVVSILSKGILILFLAYFIFRNLYLHLKLKKVERKLRRILTLANKAKALLFRLSDDEIDLFATQSSSEIAKQLKAKSCFRWHFLKSVYPLK